MPRYSYRILGDKAGHPQLPVGDVVQIDPNWSPVDPTFEYTTFGGTSGWTVAPGLTIRRVTDDLRPNPEWQRYQQSVSAMADKFPSLGSARISGRQSGADYLVKTRNFMALPDARYVFKGWMKIGETSVASPSPSFRIVLLDDAKGIVSTAESAEYDTSKLGQWQSLECRFATSSRVRQAVILVPKPKDVAMEVEFHIDDFLLEIEEHDG